MNKSQSGRVYSRMREEFRANRRLQLGLALVFGVLLVEGGLRWSDHLARSASTLADLEARRAVLQTQTRDEGALRAQLERLQLISAEEGARLWRVPSEAVGQARQKDWLLGVFKAVSVAPQSIVLAAPRPIQSDRNDKGRGADAKPRSEVSGAIGVRQFRATVLFSFTPAALESILSALEGRSAFLEIESLTVKRRERRVELSLAMLMEVGADHLGRGGVALPQVTEASAPGVPRE